MRSLDQYREILVLSRLGSSQFLFAPFPGRMRIGVRPSHCRRCKLHESTQCAEETNDGLLFPVGKGLPTLRATEISPLARKRGTPLAHCQDYKAGIHKLIQGKTADRPSVKRHVRPSHRSPAALTGDEQRCAESPGRQSCIKSAKWGAERTKR